jgi:Leucine-rich repeat (LRR) protein
MYLTGEIPDGISTLLNLQSLMLHGNQLHGPIPSTISALTSLQQLSLSENKLTGEIPSGTVPFPQK